MRLLVGQERTLNFNLILTSRAEQVSISSSIGDIDQTSAVVQGRITSTQLEGLPLNGRNWSNLLPLVAGATDAGTSDQRTVRFAGRGRDDNNISFDGVDATGISNQPQKTGIRLAVPASTLDEFKVDSTLYTADSADGTGGQIVLASRGGTNMLHGEIFEFLRNNVFDARNTFAAGKQPFRLNQFGANAGGPSSGIDRSSLSPLRRIDNVLTRLLRAIPQALLIVPSFSPNRRLLHQLSMSFPPETFFNQVAQISTGSPV